MGETDKDEGFWVEFYIEYGRGITTIECTYNYYKYEDVFVKDDDDLFKAEAEQWAQDTEGWKHERYTYGFKVLYEPPLDYINKKIMELELELIFYRGFVE